MVENPLAILKHRFSFIHSFGFVLCSKLDTCFVRSFWIAYVDKQIYLNWTFNGLIVGDKNQLLV